MYLAKMCMWDFRYDAIIFQTLIELATKTQTNTTHLTENVDVSSTIEFWKICQ